MTDIENDLELIANLERKYAHRGLKFTSRFWGLCPTQAYGYLDGKRFYFRDRHEESALALGEADRAVDEKLHHERIANFEARIEATRNEIATGEISEKRGTSRINQLTAYVEMLRNEPIPEADDPEYYPHTGERFYVSNYDYPDYFDRFCALVDMHPAA